MEKEITVIDLQEMLESDFKIQLIDVRSPENYGNYAIKGSINIPLKDISNRIPKLNGRMKTVLICEDGLKSDQAYTLLKACGFNVFTVRGGLRDWKRVFGE